MKIFSLKRKTKNERKKEILDLVAKIMEPSAEDIARYLPISVNVVRQLLYRYWKMGLLTREKKKSLGQVPCFVYELSGAGRYWRKNYSHFVSSDSN